MKVDEESVDFPASRVMNSSHPRTRPNTISGGMIATSAARIRLGFFGGAWGGEVSSKGICVGRESRGAIACPRGFVDGRSAVRHFVQPDAIAFIHRVQAELGLHQIPRVLYRLNDVSDG